jgi:ATP-dependent protease ClpP protease subunit
MTSQPNGVPNPLYLTLVSEVQDTTVQPIINGITAAINGGCTELHLLMTSNGGSVVHGLALYNILRMLPVPVITHNVANIDSIANVVFLAADERHASENATFFFHPVSLTVASDNADHKLISGWGIMARRFEDRIATLIASRTQWSVDQIHEMFRDEVTVDAETALAQGLITHIDTDRRLPTGTVVVPLLV